MTDAHDLPRILRELHPVFATFAARAMRSTGGRLEYDDAYAIAQAAAAIGLRSWSPDGGAGPLSWARTCAARAVQGAIKGALAACRYGTTMPIEENGDDDSPPTVLAWADASQERDVWRAEVASLIAPHAAALTAAQRAALDALADDSRIELADAEGITRQAVDMRIRAACARLRRALRRMRADDID